MSNFERGCYEHPHGEELFRRAVLRAVPLAKAQEQSADTAVVAFFPLGVEEYGIEPVLNCARSIVRGQCEAYEYAELGPHDFEIKPKTQEVL